ncbi:putative toxin-antitoxin system toxin component, PIN family [Cyanobacterium sp. Dongsha4]|uniref:putative toxin-antitoxin system toxin component, PIN family n=1 Tax=Cyanobacterium sp. DS4 TaxID=2878255 RepID=UPI002E81A6C7|nr:putative toxin-antitoxin system toxin component, PIN family [Cyanobacterium sp. Dongsha4]WVL02549.1 putative toxin-antitoxin system toxin component, PIN family [Cyanobacterium sp. Dongsha4]
MKKYQIVIDTNVILAGLKSSKGASFKLLSMMNDSRFSINISATLIIEYEDVLKRNSLNLGLTFDEIERFISGICSIANHHEIFFLWRPLSTDPDDDFILDLAIKSQSDFIISYNEKHLKNIKNFRIDVLNPKQFLQLLGEI